MTEEVSEFTMVAVMLTMTASMTAVILSLLIMSIKIVGSFSLKTEDQIDAAGIGTVIELESNATNLGASVASALSVGEGRVSKIILKQGNTTLVTYDSKSSSKCNSCSTSLNGTVLMRDSTHYSHVLSLLYRTYPDSQCEVRVTYDGNTMYKVEINIK